MKIADAQNRPENLELLVAQRRLYSDAKRWRGVRTLGSLLVGIPLPILAVVVPATISWVSAIGALWFAATVVLMFGVERGKIASATRVLEEFDVAVFALPWNKRVAGSQEEPETIAAAVRNNREPTECLRDWYPAAADEVPYPISVLLCQRATIVWDWRLRRSYAVLVTVLLVLLLVAAVAAAVLLNFTAAQCLLILVLPMASVFASGTATALTHISDAHEQREMQQRLDDDWRAALVEPTSITVAECRQHQDCRFNLRMRTLPVPDFWYGRLRVTYEKDMRGAAKRMVAEFQSRQDI